MIVWLIGVGIVIVAGIIVVSIAETVAILDRREDRRVLDYLRDPASITEADARLRNELARHHDQVDP